MKLELKKSIVTAESFIERFLYKHYESYYLQVYEAIEDMLASNFRQIDVEKVSSAYGIDCIISFINEPDEQFKKLMVAHLENIGYRAAWISKSRLDIHLNIHVIFFPTQDCYELYSDKR